MAEEEDLGWEWVNGKNGIIRCKDCGLVMHIDHLNDHDCKEDVRYLIEQKSRLPVGDCPDCGKKTYRYGERSNICYTCGYMG